MKINGFLSINDLHCAKVNGDYYSASIIQIDTNALFNLLKKFSSGSGEKITLISVEPFESTIEFKVPKENVHFFWKRISENFVSMNKDV